MIAMTLTLPRTMLTRTMLTRTMLTNVETCRNICQAYAAVFQNYAGNFLKLLILDVIHSACSDQHKFTTKLVYI